MRIEQVDPREASERQYAALNAISNRMRAERLPDDPPIPLDEQIRQWRNIPPVVGVTSWLVWSDDGAHPIAETSVSVLRKEENQHLVEFGISVLPEFRRQGIATRMLSLIAAFAAEERRNTLITSTVSRIPAGEAFMRRMGAQIGLESRTNQLDLRDLNRDLLPLWQARAAEHAGDFELLVWTERYPEEHLEAAARLMDAMNRAPRGTLQIEDMHWTGEHLRQFERQRIERGVQTWTMVAQERSTGRLAGFTEVTWHPNRPEILYQEGTGVLPEFQNRGLGRWLKAAMLEKVLRERPQVKRIRTGNANVNAPMLKINYELGFKPFLSHAVWQVDLAQVQAYLDSVGREKVAPI